MVPIYFLDVGTHVKIGKKNMKTRTSFGYNNKMVKMEGQTGIITEVRHKSNSVTINGFHWHIEDIRLLETKEVKEKPQIFHFDTSKL